MLIYSYPRLIAVSHVLHRLLMPRHSPYALLRLNFFRESFDSLAWFSFLYLELLEFRKQISFRISLRIEKASFFFTIESSPLGEIVLYPFFWKDLSNLF